MTNLSASPIDRARMGNTDILTAVSDMQSLLNQIRDIASQSLNEVSQDVWALNASFPSICQGRLTAQSGVPITLGGAQSDTIYFTPYQGNLVGIYNGSGWDSIPFSELQLPLKQSQSGGTHNGTAVIDGLTDTSQLVVGMWVSGTGIPVTAQISSIDSATQITMNVNSTASATVTVTFQCPWDQDIDIFIVDTGGGVLALRMIFWNVRPTGTITGITNASPMVVTSNLTPLIANIGQIVNIRNVAGATGANATWRIGAVGAGTYTLLNFDGTNSAAGGVYTGGGTDQAALGATLGRVSALTLQDGIYVLASDPTWRYLGSAHTNWFNGSVTYANSKMVTDSFLARNLWNYYNRKLRSMQVADGSASWQMAAVNTWQPVHNNIANSLYFMTGILEDNVYAQMNESVTVNAAVFAAAGIWLDQFNAIPLYSVSQIIGDGTSKEYPMTAGNIDQVLWSQGPAAPNWHMIRGAELGQNTTNSLFHGAPYNLLVAHLWG